MYFLIRSILFALSKGDHEKAHDLLKRAAPHIQQSPALLWLLSYLSDAGNNPKPFTFCGMTFPNRVGLAAGLDKDAEMPLLMQKLGFGFLNVGSVTKLPQTGNPRPRLFRVEEGTLLNRMAFNSHGAFRVYKNLHAVSPKLTVPLGISFGKLKNAPLEEAAEEYCWLLEYFWAFAEYFTLNVSSRNTPGLRTLQRREHIEAVAGAVVARRDELASLTGTWKPILVKISPDVSEEELDQTLEGLLAAQVDGVEATNGTEEKKFRTQAATDRYAHEEGAISGYPLFQKARKTVARIARVAPKLPLVGGGGIEWGWNAERMLDDGADVVQIYSTVVFNGWRSVKSIRRATDAYTASP
jgi:dihydroorotate dehydrogenase